MKEKEFDQKTIRVAINVCERRCKDIDDFIDDPNAAMNLISDKEWELLAGDELTMD
jgi:hypothetical protein